VKARIGQSAPDFTAKAYVRGLAKPQTISLTALRGRWIVLFFYPQDFTYLRPTELQEFARLRMAFAREQAVVLGASTGSYCVHRAWFEGDTRLSTVNFPVIADTSHELSTAFRVVREDGAMARGIFIIDPAGIVRHMHVNDLNAGHAVEETLYMLRALRAGARRPIDEPTVLSPETARALAVAVA
jgi:alkyl hydroperoxide reductase subunit AhpC